MKHKYKQVRITDDKPPHQNFIAEEDEVTVYEPYVEVKKKHIRSLCDDTKRKLIEASGDGIHGEIELITSTSKPAPNFHELRL